MSQKDYSSSSAWNLRPTERRPILIFGDLVAGMGALAAALYTWSMSRGEWLGFSVDFLTERVPAWFYLLPLIWLLLLIELYDITQATRWKSTIRGVAFAALFALVIYLVIYFSSPPQSLPRSAVGYFLLFVSTLTLLWRSLYIRIFTIEAFMRRVLVIGGGRAGTTLIQKLEELQPAPFILVGIIDDDPAKAGQTIGDYPVLGNSKTLANVIHEHRISEVIVSISGPMQGEMFQAILDAQASGVAISRMQSLYEDLFNRVPIFHLESEWLVRSFVEESRVSGFYLLGKRLMDILGGLVGVIGTIVALPFIVLANLVETGFPIFYFQTRSGYNGKQYNLLKFRTMQKDAEKDGEIKTTSKNDTRVTRVGWFLRKTHIDELPQFINVLKGEMSLVGPRPERPELIRVFEQSVPFYRARLLVKPGITGWAQIHQQYAGNVEETTEKLEYDLYYVKRRSLLLDVIVLLRTPSTILGLRGR